MHFLDIDKHTKISKKTLGTALLFVITAVIGIGSGAQQFCVKIFNFSPSFDLQDADLQILILQFGFHVLPFAIGIGAIFFATTKILGRSILSLFGDTSKLFKKIITVIFLYALCFCAFFFLQKNSITPLPLPASFVLISLVLVIFVLIQISFEELLFRAFLPQTLVGFGTSKLTGIILSSVIFGLLHSGNPEVATHGKIILLLYIFHGLFLGFITYFDRSIWWALAYHFSNNFLTLWLLSSKEQILKVPALYSLNEETNDLTLLFIQVFSTAGIILFIGFFCFRWKRDSQ